MEHVLPKLSNCTSKPVKIELKTLNVPTLFNWNKNKNTEYEYISMKN